MRKLICFVFGHNWNTEDWCGDECRRCGLIWEFEEPRPFVGFFPWTGSLFVKLWRFVVPYRAKCEHCGKINLSRRKPGNLFFCNDYCNDNWMPF